MLQIVHEWYAEEHDREYDQGETESDTLPEESVNAEEMRDLEIPWERTSEKVRIDMGDGKCDCFHFSDVECSVWDREFRSEIDRSESWPLSEPHLPEWYMDDSRACEIEREWSTEGIYFYEILFSEIDRRFMFS